MAKRTRPPPRGAKQPKTKTEKYLDEPISDSSQSTLAHWHRIKGKLSHEAFMAMLGDELLHLDPHKGFFKLTEKGREKYWLIHGEHPRDPREHRPAMVQYD